MRPDLVFAAFALALGACAHGDGTSAEARVGFYAEQTEAHPRNYAMWLSLSQAYLDRARQTHDPQWIAKARAAAQASMDIMPGLEAMKMQARIAGFRHRFAEQLEWATKADALLSADVQDGAVTALLVEAHMGLKEPDKARALLPPDGVPLPDFHTAAAMGHYLKAQQRLDEAAAAFATASQFARAEDQAALAAWGETMAAGVYLDAGEIDRARPHLEAAAALDPENRELRIHQAELMTAEGDVDDAIDRYESLLKTAPDPELHRRVALLAREAGDDALAQRHYEAAEAMFVRALEAHEIYALDELIRLYTDASMDAAEARRRAEAHLRPES